MGTQEIFSGDVYVTKNGVSKLFIMTAEYHAHERALHQHASEQKDLMRQLVMAMQSIDNGMTNSADESLARLREANA